MSKDQKNYFEIPVDTVDNFAKSLDYSISSLKFWHKEKEWPTNLIHDCLSEMKNIIDFIIDSKIIEDVSRSHINDK